MCMKKFIPKAPTIEAPQAPAQQAMTSGQEDPDLGIEDEGSTKVKRDKTRRGGLRIDVNMGGGGRSARGVNLPS
jgi:hypothetical protein